MSGSPKYSTARLRREQEARLRRERERRAAEERKRREAEQRRRKLERLRQAQSEARTEHRRNHEQLSQFAASEAGRLVSDQLQELTQRLERCASSIDKAGDESEVQHAQQQLDAIQAELSRTVVQGETALHQQHLSAAEAAVAAVETKARHLNVHHSGRFDPDGLSEIRATVAKARKSLEADAPAEAQQLSAQCNTLLTRHNELVERERLAWSSAKDAAREPLAAADDEVAGLLVDEVAQRWRKDEVATLQKRLRDQQNAFHNEQFDSVADQCRDIAEQARQLIEQANQEQLKEDRRRYIVQGIVEVMQAKGFVIQPGFPKPQDPADVASETLIHGQRLGGGAIFVSVPQDDDVWYDVEGFPNHEAVNGRGQVVKSCDEAEQQLLALHSALDATFGIAMSELQWEGKDPDRIQRAADELPTSSETSRTTQQSR